MLRSGICLAVATCAGFAAGLARAEGLPEALAKAYRRNDYMARMFLAGNPAAAKGQLEELSGDPEAAIRATVARNRLTPPTVLGKLAKDADVTVLLFVNRKVVANFAFRSGELTDAKVEEITLSLPKLFEKAK